MRGIAACVLAGLACAACLEAPPGADVAGEPSAAFASQASFLEVSFDASGSHDPDGFIDSYSWSFGDGTTGTGVALVHVYDEPGTYGVKLTVTDDEGRTDAITAEVTVTEATAPLAADAFDRVVEESWGEADVGGPWSTPVSDDVNVTGGRAAMTLDPAVGHGADLEDVSTISNELEVLASTDELATGGAIRFLAAGRRVGNMSYMVTVALFPEGNAQTKLEVGTEGETGLVVAGPLDVPDYSHEAGDVLAVRLQVIGTDPTVLRASVWPADRVPPATWMLATTDDTPSLQQAGHVALGTYLSASATVTPVTISFDDFVVREID